MNKVKYTIIHHDGTVENAYCLAVAECARKLGEKVITSYEPIEKKTAYNATRMEKFKDRKLLKAVGMI